MIVPDTGEGRQQAIAVLQSGGIVAIPTDTVYGICCRLDAPDGIARLFAAKGRSPDRAIMLLLADENQAEELGVFSPAAAVLADAFWPGGLTLVLDRRPGVELPEALTGGAPTIGLRVPDHPCPRGLAAAVGPIPATSANRSGEPEASTAEAIAESLGSGIDLILDGGPARGGPPSTVVDCTGDAPRILRPGSIATEDIERILEAVGLRLAPPDVGR